MPATAPPRNTCNQFRVEVEEQPRHGHKIPTAAKRPSDLNRRHASGSSESTTGTKDVPACGSQPPSRRDQSSPKACGLAKRLPRPPLVNEGTPIVAKSLHRQAETSTNQRGNTHRRKKLAPSSPPPPFLDQSPRFRCQASADPVSAQPHNANPEAFWIIGAGPRQHPVTL